MDRRGDSGPAAPVAIVISDVPVAPVALSFASGPEPVFPVEPQRKPRLASRGRRLAGFVCDLVCVAFLFITWVAVAARLAGGPRDIAGVLLVAPLLWAASAGGACPPPAPPVVPPPERGARPAAPPPPVAATGGGGAAPLSP